MSSKPLRDELRETLAVFENSGPGTPLTTSEVADSLDMGRRSTYDRLDRLVDRGRLETKKVGARGRVWWRPIGSPGMDERNQSAADPLGIIESLTGFLDDDAVGVFLSNEHREVTSISSGVEDLFGFDREDVVGRDIRTLAESDIAPMVEDSEALVEEISSSHGEDASKKRSVFRERTDRRRQDRVFEYRNEPIDSGQFAGGCLHVFEDVSDQHRAESALLRTQDQFRSLVQTVEEYAIFMLDPSGRVRTWNEGAEQIKGYHRKDILGKHFSTFYTAEDREAGVPEANLEAAASEGLFEDEGWRVRADGSKFWAQVTISPIVDDGDLQGFAKVTRNMSERREQQRELRRERDLVERILDVAPVGIALVSPDGTVSRANRHFEKHLGVDTTDERTSVDEWDVYVDGEYVPCDERPHEMVQQTGAPVSDWECQIDRPTGESRWFTIDAVPLEKNGAVDRVLIAAEDVTLEKEQARRLERQRDELKAELENVVDRVSDGFFGLDTEFRFTLVNEETAELLGRSESDLLGTPIRNAFESELLSPDALLEVLESREPTTVEEHFEPLDRWFEVHVYPSDLGLSVYIWDVTDRKRREQELERYATIVDSLWDGVYALDPDERFVMANDTFLKMTGYDREELLGQHASVVHEDESVSELAAERSTEAAIGDSEGAVLEFDLRTSEGETITVESRFGPYQYDDERKARTGVVRDISQRKRYEKTLRTLYDSAGDLFEVETPQEVSEVVVETATDVLDLSGVMAYLYDDDTEQLLPTTTSLESDFIREDPPSVPPDDSTITGHVYANGKSQLYDDITDSPYLQTDATEMRAGVFAPMGEHGLLIVGSREVGAFDEQAKKLVELLAANGKAAMNRVQRERDLEESKQRYRTLIDNFPNGLVALLDEELRYVIVGGEMFDGLGFSATDLEGELINEHLSGDILETLEPKYRAALDGETCEFEFEYNEQIRHFRILPVTDENGVVFAALGMSQDVTQQRERERELERQREQLAALINLNDIVQDTTEAIIEQSTREEIEEIVCEQLAESDSYSFAWIGDVDVQSQTVNLRTEAGVEGYLDGVTISVDENDERSQGPTGQAILTREMQVTREVVTDSSHDPWRDHIREFDFRSSAAIPIIHEDTLYGVLNVYSERPKGFSENEQAVIGHLGETIGLGIAAAERKRALTSDHVVELEFRVQSILEELDDSIATEGTITIDRAIPIDDGAFVEYGTAKGDSMELVEAVVESDAFPQWKSVSILDSDDERTRFELLLQDPPVLSTVVSHGGYIDAGRIEDGNYYNRIHLSPHANVRQVVAEIESAYEEIEMISQRQITRDRELASELRGTLFSELTERQRNAIEAAFYAGYFEWPRRSTGEAISDSLGISPPTFHQHLRKAERRLLASIFED